MEKEWVEIRKKLEKEVSQRMGLLVAQARELTEERGRDKLIIVKSMKVEKGMCKGGERGWGKGEGVFKVGKAKGR